ncbi:MAG: S8 family serine peptidase [Candidatus Saliniplasma sp.]
MKIKEGLALCVVMLLIVSSLGVAFSSVIQADEETKTDIVSESDPNPKEFHRGRDGVLSESIRREKSKKDEKELVEVVIRLDSYEAKEIERTRALDIHEEGTEFARELKSYTEREQSNVKALVDEGDGDIINTFWIANAILAEVEYGELDRLASLDNVWRIHENFEVEINDSDTHGSGSELYDNEGRWTDLMEPRFEEDFRDINTSFGSDRYDDSYLEKRKSVDPTQGSNDDLTWGLDRINVTDVWDDGRNGSGIRVAVSDTGVDIEHPDLEGKMTTVDEDDEYHPGGWIEIDENGFVVEDSTPHDTGYHGTHCSGTILGGNTSGTSIGVAPGAELMHALTLPGGSANIAQLIRGLEWKVEPFDRHGDPLHEKYGGNVSDYRPHVASMSWGASIYEEEFEEPIQNLKDAGVVPVTSMGNSGEGSIGSPGAIYESFGIGASDKKDEIARFSSGDIVEDGRYDTPEEYVKPDFAAPGVEVMSSFPDGDYGELSGTSMAAPHVAGSIALMYDTHLSVDDIYRTLEETSDYYEAGDTLNGSKNTRYGYGIIDAGRAVDHISYYLSVNNAEERTNDSVLLKGELLEMPKEEVDVFFRYRKKSENEWSTTEKQGLNETGVFEYRLEGLEKATTYEYQVVGNWTGEQNNTLTRTFTTHRDVEVLTLPEENLTNDNATIRGEVIGIYLNKADIFFRHRKTGEEWNKIEMGTINETKTLGVELGNLENFTSYEYQVVAEADGKEFPGEVFRFTTVAMEPEWSDDMEAYMITTACELQWIRNDLESDYIIEDDIDASETRDWFGGKGFRPIQDGSKPFSGRFDGNGSTIENLYINRSEEENVGFFGMIDNDTQIIDIYLKDVNITGDVFVGGLGAYNLGQVIDSNVSGTVRGLWYVGGLVGVNFPDSLIEKSYSSATVEGEVYVGGLVGVNDNANISTSYTTGKVNCIGMGFGAGGLLGLNYEGRVENSNSSGDVEGFGYLGGLVGLNTGFLKDSFAAADIGGDIYVGGLIGMNDGGTFSNSHYNIEEVSINDDNLITICGLFDEQYKDWINNRELDIEDYEDSLAPAGDHYEISDIQGLRDLLGFADRDDYKFSLAGDIDLSDEPGLYIPYLEADFDGNNNMISNLQIDQTIISQMGMFGYLHEARVENIGLVDLDVTGYYYIGGLIGFNNNGTVSESYTSGYVNGLNSLGGLVGYNRGTVERSYSTVTVSGNYAGGLAGENSDGTINNSYATGSVQGDHGVGGLVGYNWGMVENSFWDTDTSGQHTSEGGVGKTTDLMVIEDTYSDAGWNFEENWDIIEDKTYPFLRWQEKGTYPHPPKAIFEVDITDHDEQVGKGGETTVEYEVTNREDLEGTQTIEFLVDGELEDTKEVDLGADGFKNWEHSLHDRVVYSVHAQDGVVYSGSWDGTVLAYDGETEEELWRHEEHSAGVISVHYEDGVIYSGSNDNTVVAYDVESQEKLWGHEEHDDTVESVFVEDGVVYSGSWDGTVVAYDSEAQEKLWIHEEHSDGVLSVHAEDGVVYSGGLDGSVLAYDVETQEKLWSHEEHGEEFWSVYHSDGIVYSGSSDNSVIAYNANIPGKIWEHQEHEDVVESVFVEDGVVYSGSWDGTVLAYDAVWRETLWEHKEHGDAEVMSVNTKDGLTYSGSMNGSVIAYSVGDIYEGEFTWDTTGEEMGDYNIEVSSEDDIDGVDITVVEGIDLNIKDPIGEGVVNIDGELVEELPQTEVFLEDDDVTLEAVPSENWEFDKWEIDGTVFEDREISITMDQDKEVTVHFKLKTYPLGIETKGEGSVDIDPIQEEYEHGEEVNLTAVPDEGHDFIEWTGSYEGTGEQITVTMDGYKEVIAHFEIKTYSLNADEKGNGSIEIKPDKEEYEHGEEVNLTAVPDEGYGLSEWAGSYKSTEEHITITMDDYKVINAHFLEEANFEVEIIDHDKEVIEGEEFIVNYTVTNTGELEDIQTIEFIVDGEVKDVDNVTLEGDEVYQGELVWTTGEPGEYTISVVSDDDEYASAESITVEEKSLLTPWMVVVIGLIIMVLIVLGGIQITSNKERSSGDEYDRIIWDMEEEFDKDIEDMDDDLDEVFEDMG